MKEEQYWINKLNENRGSSARTWKSISKLLRSTSDVSPEQTSTPLSADAFKSAFESKVDSVRSKTGTRKCTDSRPSSSVKLHELELCCEEEVQKVIMGSPSKSCELDPIPTYFLKEILDVLLPFLTEMFNASLKEGSLPLSQRHAIVTPLLKKYNLDRSDTKNYRPVSNLSFLSKTVERLVSRRITIHLSENNLMPSKQSAYRKGHSTETVLLRVTSDILSAMDRGQVTLLCLLDLSAAFDTVDIDLLVHRLNTSFGLQGTALKWVHNFLTERTQQVRYGQTCSTVGSLQCGVPQGSVLGPLLFSLYTAELFDVVEKHELNCHSYADDTQLYISIRAEEADAAVERLLRAICDIDEWMDTSRLCLNADKTQFIWLGSRQQMDKININKILLSSSTVPLSNSVKDLGVMLDGRLSLSQYISTLCKSCFFQLRQLRTVKRCMPKHSRETLVHAFVSSRLDYGNSLLYGIGEGQLDRLQRVQNSAARLVTGGWKFCHITPILKDLHWLPIRQRIEYKEASLVYKCLHNQAPCYLSECCVPRVTEGRSLRAISSHQLHVPRTKTKIGERAFQIAGPTVWNGLPKELRNPDLSLSAFHRNLKTVLFNRAYN